MVKVLSKALGYGTYEQSGLEADDLIASAVKIFDQEENEV